MTLTEINAVLVSRGCSPLVSLGTRDGWELVSIEPYPAHFNDHYITHRFIARKPGTDEYCIYDMQDSGTDHCMVIAIVPAPYAEDTLIVMVRQSRAPLEGKWVTELPRAGSPFMANLKSFGGYGEVVSSDVVPLATWKDEHHLSSSHLSPAVKNLMHRELGPLVQAQVATRGIFRIGRYPVNTGRSREGVEVYLFVLDIDSDRLRAIQSSTPNWKLRYHTLGEVLDNPGELAGDPDSAAGIVRFQAWLRAQRRNVVNGL